MNALADNFDRAIRSSLQETWHSEPPVDPQSCPDEELLASYTDGLLGSRGADSVERHLSSCSRCWQAIVFNQRLSADLEEAEFSPVPEPLLRQLVNQAPTVAPKPSIRDAIISKLTEVLKSLRSLGESLAFWNVQPLSVRGLALDERRGFITIQRNFRTFRVKVLVERLDDHLYEVKVMVRDYAGSPLSNGVRATLLSSRRELASYTLERGSAVFEDARAGTYIIRVFNQKHERGDILLNIEGE